MSKPLEGRIALVTGASRGIGYHTALELARLGAHVIAVARTQGGLEDLDDEIRALGGEATLVPLDLTTDFAGIDRLGHAILRTLGQAGHFCRQCGHARHDFARSAMIDVKIIRQGDNVNLNVTAIWRLIRSLDPLLRLSDDGRALLLSSSVAHSARKFWAPYAASKAAVEVMARSWADENINLKLRVNSVDPGATRTAMRAQVFRLRCREKIRWICRTRQMWASSLPRFVCRMCAKPANSTWFARSASWTITCRPEPALTPCALRLP